MGGLAAGWQLHICLSGVSGSRLAREYCSLHPPSLQPLPPAPCSGHLDTARKVLVRLRGTEHVDAGKLA